MKTYYLTFIRTDWDHTNSESLIREREVYLEVQAPDILTASRMADLYCDGFRAGAGLGPTIECNKVSLFPSRKPRK